MAHLAVPGGLGDSAHRARQPPVLPLQCQRQIGPAAVVGLLPPGRDGAQLPQGLLVCGPAGCQLVAAAADPAGNQDLVDPLFQGGELAGAAGLVEVVPAGRGRAAGRGRVEGVGDLRGQRLELGDQVGGTVFDSGRVHAAVENAQLAARVG